MCQWRKWWFEKKHFKWSIIMVRPQRNKFYICITLCGVIFFALILTESRKRKKIGIDWFYHVIMLWFILNWIKHLYRNDWFRTTSREEKCGRYFCRIGLSRLRFPSLFKKEMINIFYSLSNKATNLYNKQAIIKRNNTHIIQTDYISTLSSISDNTIL